MEPVRMIFTDIDQPSLATMILDVLASAVENEAPITKDELFAITFDGVFSRAAFDRGLEVLELANIINTCGTNIVWWQGALN